MIASTPSTAIRVLQNFRKQVSSATTDSRGNICLAGRLDKRTCSFVRSFGCNKKLSIAYENVFGVVLERRLCEPPVQSRAKQYPFQPARAVPFYRDIETIVTIRKVLIKRSREFSSTTANKFRWNANRYSETVRRSAPWT